MPAIEDNVLCLLLSTMFGTWDPKSFLEDTVPVVVENNTWYQLQRKMSGSFCRGQYLVPVV